MAARAVRPIRMEGNIAFVPLSQGKEAVIDAVDIQVVDQRNWHARHANNIWYASTCTKKSDGGQPRKLHLHRVILNAPENLEVDHIDGDGLNNRRANLRLATKSQNQANRGVPVNNASGFSIITFIVNKC